VLAISLSWRLLQVLGDISISYIRNNIAPGLDLASLVSALLTFGIACRKVLISGHLQVLYVQLVTVVDLPDHLRCF